MKKYERLGLKCIKWKHSPQDISINLIIPCETDDFTANRFQQSIPHRSEKRQTNEFITIKLESELSLSTEQPSDFQCNYDERINIEEKKKTNRINLQGTLAYIQLYWMIHWPEAYVYMFDVHCTHYITALFGSANDLFSVVRVFSSMNRISGGIDMEQC